MIHRCDPKGEDLQCHFEEVIADPRSGDNGSGSSMPTEGR